MLGNFLDADGRLHTIPTKHAKLLVVLDFLAQSFEPGVQLPGGAGQRDPDAFHPDYAALRRYLVENGFLDRGPTTVYWRSGGTSMSELPDDGTTSRASHLQGEDWYGDELVDVVFEECTFSDVDLTEATTRGVMFRECTFHNCRFNASTHVSIGVRRRPTSGAATSSTSTLDGCKLDGSVFAECTMRPMKVTGGQWRS